MFCSVHLQRVNCHSWMYACYPWVLFHLPCDLQHEKLHSHIPLHNFLHHNSHLLHPLHSHKHQIHGLLHLSSPPHRLPFPFLNFRSFLKNHFCPPAQLRHSAQPIKTGAELPRHKVWVFNLLCWDVWCAFLRNMDLGPNACVYCAGRPVDAV